jgi:UDP-N-acetylmuramate dehydrogenase
MKGIVLSVEVLDAKTLKVKSFKNKDCKFYYRESVFGHKENLIIVSAVLRLKRGNKSEIREKIKEYSDYRIKTQPLNYPSAGSVFKNPKGFFAAKLIEDCGLKGKKIGKAKVSEKHANFIVNLGGAKEKDVKSLIKLVKEKVKKKFGVVLEEEIRFL